MGVSHYPANGPARYNRCIEITIRRFEERDLPGIVRLERESFERDAWPRETFLEYARAVPELFLVATVLGRFGREKIAGYSIASLTRHGGEIDSIAVRRRYRQRGVAAALLDTIFRKLRRRGVEAISLMVRRENESAIRLYRKVGFVRTATVPDYYENGASKVGWRMRKDLVG